MSGELLKTLWSNILFEWREKMVDLTPNVLQHMVCDPLYVPSTVQAGDPAGDELNSGVGNSPY